MCYESYIIDEGGPLDIALQEEISNHLKLLCLRGMVVSVEEKACQHGKMGGPEIQAIQRQPIKS